MPFTLSHPSAALPFWPLIRRGFVPLAPFVVGAMAPDFEYLLRLEPWALLSHSALGVFVFCLPIGVATWILWVMLLHPVARALVALPPATPRLPRTVGGWLLVVIAVLLGSSTHVFWDALTHRDTWGPVVFPILGQTAFTVGSYRVPWYNVLQLTSSLLGGVLVLAWLRQEIVRRGDRIAALLAPWRVRAWLALAAAALAVAVWNAPRQGIMTHITRTKLVLGRMAVGALVGLAIGLVALAVLHRLGRLRITDDGTDRPGETYAT
ncbi:MAG: DUF4184 family protein [Gemmatimonadetes bacterium]|nr:DUF4184 family protein [Gemmatimonadota bacterium]